MIERKKIFSSLKKKMKEAGFIFEVEQKPHKQKRKETELKFTHPKLLNSFQETSDRIIATKFYIKPLSDEEDCEIGLVTGITSPLFKVKKFIKPNTKDSHKNNPAWTNRENDSSLDKLFSQIKHHLSSEDKTSNNRPNSFIIVWNPQKMQWKDLRENIETINNVGYVVKRWSCGNSKKIKIGDRFFLIIVGKGPRGIMGSGYAKSPYYSSKHWSLTEKKNINYIDIEFDILIDPYKNTIFGSKLINKTDPDKYQHWFSQINGISIHSEIASKLESSWFEFIRENRYFNNEIYTNNITSEKQNIYIEGAPKEVTQTRYERNPQARVKCLNRYGYCCQVCKFNFEETFGKIGKEFIHVHHINPIASFGKEYNIDPENDLIPVCPNCHAMIHTRSPVFTIEEIREKIKITASEKAVGRQKN